MKRLVIKLILFFLAVTLVYSFVNYVASNIVSVYKGQTTEQKIELGFKNSVDSKYDSYILGNSKTYRGINPDLITKYTAFNFSHDNDNYNQMYYKLLTLEKHNKNIKTIIIGSDYNHFSYFSNTRNYVYDRYFGYDYIKDYNESLIKEYLSDFSIYSKIAGENIIRALYLMLKKEPIANVNHMKENGQFIVYGTATKNDYVKRDGTILDIQMKYFDLIVKNCIENNIKLYTLIPPTRDEELDSYCWSKDEFNGFDDMIKIHLTDKYKNNFLNYSNDTDFKDLSNFVDIAHLNEKGADKFTIKLNEDID